MATAQLDRPADGMSNEQATQLFKGIAEGFRTQLRSPIFRTPAEVGLSYEDVTFPSEDGVPLEGWLIPRSGSDKLIIANHPRWFNRYGLPCHLEPWKSQFGGLGNDFEVNFIPDYKILHAAGYNILTYDLRNHGHSGAGNGGLITSGRYESRDVVGSLAYARGRSETSGMTIGLFSRCLGCSSTIIAMARRPDVFANVRCMVGVQPISVRAIMTKMIAARGLPAERIDDLDAAIQLVTSFPIDKLSPREEAKAVDVPSLIYQVRDDLMTTPDDVQAIFDAIPAEKELFWIEGTTRRWDGYTYFQREPARILAWLTKFMT